MENRKEVYFDNSATTRVFDSVRDVMVEAMTSDYGNTSSRHMKGVEAERYIREAREEIAGSLKVKEKEIVFTSGGTESNNMALIGAAMAARRPLTVKQIILIRLISTPLIQDALLFAPV